MRTAMYYFMSFRPSSMMCHALVLLAVLCCIQPAQAQPVILGFNSLPTAQGWTYIGTPSENNIYSLGTNTLQQNSMGIGARGPYYAMPVVNVTQSFTLDFRGRVLQEEFTTPQLVSFGYGIEVDYLTRSFIIGLGANRVMLFDGNSSFFTLSVDTSLFHDYRFTGSPFTNTWQLSIDGTLVGTGSAAFFTRSNDLNFGDIASSANVQGEWTRLEFSQAVPEPSTWITLGASALGFGIYLWRQRRHQAKLAME